MKGANLQPGQRFRAGGQPLSPDLWFVAITEPRPSAQRTGELFVSAHFSDEPEHAGGFIVYLHADEILQTPEEAA